MLLANMGDGPLRYVLKLCATGLKRDALFFDSHSSIGHDVVWHEGSCLSRRTGDSGGEKQQAWILFFKNAGVRQDVQGSF